MTLSQEQLDTLWNLSRKKSGATIGWVAIGPARALTELGLAARSRCGWEITPDGEAALESQREAPGGVHLAPLLQFPVSGHPVNP